MTSQLLSYRKSKFGAKCNFILFKKKKKEKETARVSPVFLSSVWIRHAESSNSRNLFLFFSPMGEEMEREKGAFDSTGCRQRNKTPRCLYIYSFSSSSSSFTVWQRATGVYVYPLFSFSFFFSFKFIIFSER